MEIFRLKIGTGTSFYGGFAGNASQVAEHLPNN